MINLIPHQAKYFACELTRQLSDKFFLPSVLLETKSFNEEVKKRNLNPFNQDDSIVICSFQFARNKGIYLEQMPWDLVIIDEAHRLRNVYKPSNKMENNIRVSFHSNKTKR